VDVGEQTDDIKPLLYVGSNVGELEGNSVGTDVGRGVGR